MGCAHLGLFFVERACGCVQVCTSEVMEREILIDPLICGLRQRSTWEKRSKAIKSNKRGKKTEQEQQRTSRYDKRPSYGCINTRHNKRPRLSRGLRAVCLYLWLFVLM